jgi:hypothetical protein
MDVSSGWALLARPTRLILFLSTGVLPAVLSWQPGDGAIWFVEERLHKRLCKKQQECEVIRQAFSIQKIE